MNQNEAYAALQLKPGATEEEIKKQYKTLAKRFHPDLDKTPGAEERFKKINEAFQTINNPQPEPQRGNWAQAGHGFDVSSIFSEFFNFNGFGHPGRTVQVPKISIPVTLSFSESVLGCEKEITISRKEMCGPCRGVGSVMKDTGAKCTVCNGQGRVQTIVGAVAYVQPCQATKPNCHAALVKVPDLR